jgi:hypothetical protein
MEEAPLFNTEFDESDKKFRELLRVRGFEGVAAESIIDRTRGNEAARQAWYDAYGHLLQSEQDTKEEVSVDDKEADS